MQTKPLNKTAPKKSNAQMAKKQKQTSQDAGAPQDETPSQPREKRKENTTPVQKKEKPRPTEQ